MVTDIAFSKPNDATMSSASSSDGTWTGITTPEYPETVLLPDPLELLSAADEYFDDAAFMTGFADYWEVVAPKLQKLLHSYLDGAFRVMGADLNKLPTGAPVPAPSHLSKHKKVMDRLFEILEEGNIVEKSGTGHVKGPGNLTSSAQSGAIVEEIVAEHPQFAVDARMMAVTGPKLGECLTGSVDPLALMFRTADASKVLEDFYLKSPMFSTLTEHMVSFLGGLLNSLDGRSTAPLKILEVGAGLGGTTSRLIEFIQAMGVPVEYTFTDISRSLVTEASAKYQKHASWMNFRPFNMEETVAAELRGQYHVVIGTMVVHATSDRARSCSRLYDLLSDGGMMLLSEGTLCIDWYDIAFGLLDGWWLSGDYALQPAEVWMQDLRRAGFQKAGYSSGPSREANTQRLLVGWKTGSD